LTFFVFLCIFDIIEEGGNVKIGNYISGQLHGRGKNNKWLARRLNMTESTLSSKFKKDTFTAKELILIAHLLDINLEELKETIIMTNDIYYADFDDQTFEVRNFNPNSPSVNYDDPTVQLKFEVEDLAYYVLLSVVDDGERSFLCVTRDNEASGWRIVIVQEYRLRQMKAFGLEAKKVNLSLSEVARRTLGKNEDVSGIRILQKAFLEFEKDPVYF